MTQNFSSRLFMVSSLYVHSTYTHTYSLPSCKQLVSMFTVYQLLKVQDMQDFTHTWWLTLTNHDDISYHCVLLYHFIYQWPSYPIPDYSTPSISLWWQVATGLSVSAESVGKERMQCLCDCLAVLTVQYSHKLIMLVFNLDKSLKPDELSIQTFLWIFQAEGLTISLYVI